MNFETKVDIWKNEGSEPDTERKEKGFEGGYYPPASIFNWLYHLVTKGIKELQTKLSGHAADNKNPHGVTAKQIGAAETNHKHPYAINIGYDRTDIDSGADLNDILTMGCYRCSTATKAATLLNCPTKNAFIMDMIASTGGNETVDVTKYSYGTQRIYSLGGREYVRQVTSNGDGTITYGEWITMYSTLDKPTPTDIGAVNTSFSNIPDRTVALKNLHATDNFKGTVNGKEFDFDTALTQAEYSVAGTNLANAPYSGSIFGKLIVFVNSGGTHDNVSNWIWQVFYSTSFGRIYFRMKVNEGEWSEWGAIYNQNYKPTAEDVEALPLSGGVMTGQGFYINNKSGRIVGNQNGMWFRTASSDVDNNEDARHLKFWNASYVSELTRALCLFDTKTGKDYAIYGEHNAKELGVAKIQTGNYTGDNNSGNGYPTTININFKPKYVYIWDNDGLGYIEVCDKHGAHKSVTYDSNNALTTSSIYLTWGEKSLSWYVSQTATSDNRSEISKKQLNSQGVTYKWIAIG